MTLTQFIGVTIFLFGLAFGSFLNVCIYRLPRDRSVVRPGSACPNCGQPIRSRDNIPVLSWLLLGGRCRDCRAPISPRYAAVELLTAGLFLGVYLRFGFSLVTLKFCIFAFLILGLIFTDAETKLLPDALTLPGLAVGIAFSLLVPLEDLVTAFLPGIAGLRDPAAVWRWLSLGDAVFGALVGAGFIYGAGVLYLHARGIEGMGFGDVKLMAMVGAFLGVRLTLLTIFLASLLGAVFGVCSMLVVWLKRTRRRIERQHEPAGVARRRAWVSARIMLRHYQMPFGVFLGSVAMIAVFAGEPFLRWYWSRF